MALPNMASPETPSPNPGRANRQAGVIEKMVSRSQLTSWPEEVARRSSKVGSCTRNRRTTGPRQVHLQLVLTQHTVPLGSMALVRGRLVSASQE